jgi:hypothetical protein
VAIARQWHGRHVSTAATQQAAVEEMLDVVFSILSLLRLHSENRQEK